MKTCAKTIFPRKICPIYIIRKKLNTVIQIIHRKNGDFVDKFYGSGKWWTKPDQFLWKLRIKDLYTDYPTSENGRKRNIVYKS